MVARPEEYRWSSCRATAGFESAQEWLDWHEGVVTLRTIATSLRMRSEGHISNLIKRCDREFSRDAVLLGWFDASIALLRT